MKTESTKTDYGVKLALIALQIGAIRVRPDNPFTWASGYRMPIYNDNRMLLYDPGNRRVVTDGFERLVFQHGVEYDVIAGTATAGIPFGVMLADRLNAPFVYIRKKSKGHGLQNLIEGISAGSDLNNKKVILIEDLISTGGSSIDAVNAIRAAKGRVEYCLSIFNYMLKGMEDNFLNLAPPVKTFPILDYNTLIQVAMEQGHIRQDHVGALQEWREDPFAWGEKYGFSGRVNK